MSSLQLMTGMAAQTSEDAAAAGAAGGAGPTPAASGRSRRAACPAAPCAGGRQCTAGPRPAAGRGWGAGTSSCSLAGELPADLPLPTSST